MTREELNAVIAVILSAYEGLSDADCMQLAERISSMATDLYTSGFDEGVAEALRFATETIEMTDQIVADMRDSSTRH